MTVVPEQPTHSDAVALAMVPAFQAAPESERHFAVAGDFPTQNVALAATLADRALRRRATKDANAFRYPRRNPRDAGARQLGENQGQARKNHDDSQRRHEYHSASSLHPGIPELMLESSDADEHGSMTTRENVAPGALRPFVCV